MPSSASMTRWPADFSTYASISRMAAESSTVRTSLLMISLLSSALFFRCPGQAELFLEQLGLPGLHVGLMHARAAAPFEVGQRFQKRALFIGKLQRRLRARRCRCT